MSVKKENMNSKTDKKDDVLKTIKQKYGDIKTRTITVRGKSMYIREPSKKVLSEALVYLLDEKNQQFIEAGEVIYKNCLLKEVSDDVFINNDKYITSACIVCGKVFEDYFNEDEISFEKEVKNGKVVEEILEKYKIDSVNIIKYKDKVAYIRDPKRQTVSRAMTHLMDLEKPKMIAAGEIILKECIINEYSDIEFIQDDKFVFISAFKCCELVEIYEGELKKNY